LRIAPREVTLLSPGRIFIAPDAGDERVPFVLRHRLLKRDRFQLMRYRHRIVGFVANAASPRFLIDLYDQIQFVMHGRPFPELEHLRKLISGIDV
jgi:hypothetical protein